MTTGGVLARTEPIELSDDEIPMAVDRGRGWATIREAGPVVRVGDQVLLTRAADVLHALRHPEEFSSKQAFDQAGCPLPMIPISLDPPNHTRYRKLLQPFFSPRALAAMVPDLRRQAEGLVARLATAGSCDAVAEIAVPYPSQVFLTMFGLPLADRDMLIGWKDCVMAAATTPNPEPAAMTGALELFTYIAAAIHEKRANPAGDLLSQLLTGEDALSDEDAVGLCFTFVLAGLDTVTSALGFALWKLATRPDLRATLRARPDRMGEFVEELLRLEDPVPTIPRVTTRALEVGGVPLPAGTLVWVALGGINREETDQALPGDVLLDGVARRHWAFGSGPHRCLGSHLARMELQLVLNAWLAAVPEFTLAPGADPRIPFPAATYQFTAMPLVYPVP
jgi:cytochrome P450